MDILRPGSIKIERDMKTYPAGRIFTFFGLMGRSSVLGKHPNSPHGEALLGIQVVLMDPQGRPGASEVPGAPQSFP